VKLLGIVGSPRKGANSTALLERLLAGAREERAKVRAIRPWEMRIAPCLACDACFKHGRCVVKDDFQSVYDLILGSDGLALATPIYFGAVSAQVKPLIDRCQCFWAMRDVAQATMPPAPAGGQRKGVLIATAAQVRESMFDGARVTFKYLMRSLQGQVYVELLYGGYDERSAILRNPVAMKRAYNVGRRLALGLEPEGDAAC
jgi:multimeric flavodoxin WrbA